MKPVEVAALFLVFIIPPVLFYFFAGGWRMGLTVMGICCITGGLAYWMVITSLGNEGGERRTKFAVMLVFAAVVIGGAYAVRLIM